MKDLLKGSTPCDLLEEASMVAFGDCNRDNSEEDKYGGICLCFVLEEQLTDCLQCAVMQDCSDELL